MPPQTVAPKPGSSAWDTAKVVRPPTVDDWDASKPVASHVVQPPKAENFGDRLTKIAEGPVNLVKRVGTAIADHPAEAGALAGAAIAAPFTGGASLLPAAAIIGGSAAVGASFGPAIKDKIKGVTPTREEQQERDKVALQQGVGMAAGEGAGRAISYALGKATPRVAEWLYDLGLRPPRAVRQQFDGVNRPAAVGLRETLLPNVEAVQARISEIEREVAEAVAKSDLPPDVRGYLPAGTRDVEIPLGAAPTGESGAAVSGAMPRPSMVDPRRLQGGGDAPMPFANAGTGPRPAGGFSGPGVMRRTEPLPTVSAHGAPPTMIDPRQIAADATRYVLEHGNIADAGLRQKAIDQAKALTEQYLAENIGPMTVERALRLKRAEQGLASASYLQIARGGEVNNVETLFHQGLANAARRAVIAKAPAVEGLLAREQGLIGLKQAAEFAADRPEVLARYVKAMSVITGISGGVAGGNVGAGAAGGIVGAAVLHAIQSPTLSGAIALATKQLGRGSAALTPTVMRAISAAYLGEAPTAAEMSSHRGAR